MGNNLFSRYIIYSTTGHQMTHKYGERNVEMQVSIDYCIVSSMLQVEFLSRQELFKMSCMQMLHSVWEFPER